MPGNTNNNTFYQQDYYYNEPVLEVHVIGNERVPVVRSLIRAVVEDLQELRTSQVEHKLRVQAELFRETKRVRVVLSVLSKLLTLHANTN